MASGAHSLFRKAIRGWFYLEERRALGALKPTVSGIGFYLHKDLGAAEVGILVGILSTQRFRRGRDLDFIYATNSSRPGSDFIYTHTFYGVCFNTNVVSIMGAVVNTISALRALVLQNLLRTMSEFWLTYKVVWSMVRSAYWGRGWWKSSVVDEESGFGGHNTYWVKLSNAYHCVHRVHKLQSRSDRIAASLQFLKY